MAVPTLTWLANICPSLIASPAPVVRGWRITSSARLWTSVDPAGAGGLVSTPHSVEEREEPNREVIASVALDPCPWTKRSTNIAARLATAARSPRKERSTRAHSNVRPSIGQPRPSNSS